MNEIKDNPLYISWCDSAWLPLLNPSTVLDYFSERSNPFYDRTCNNEIVKMQRLSIDQLSNMQGIEYILLHVQEPILYVIRKQHRHSPSQVTPIADYYIIAGTVYQAPDLMSIINFRILSAVHHLQSAFDEAYSYSRYHPSKGYWWEFSKDSDKDNSDKQEKSSKDKSKEEAVSSTKFQRKRVDILLSELAKKFPPKLPQPQNTVNANEKQTNALVGNNNANPNELEMKTEIKVEKCDTPANQTNMNLANSVSNFRSLPIDKKQRIG